REGDQERQMDPEVRGLKEGEEIGADPEERHVAEVKEPGKSHDDVEAEGQRGVEADARQHPGDIVIRREEGRDERGGEDTKAEREPSREPAHRYTFSQSGRDSPRSPVGRNTRVRIRIRKAMTSLKAGFTNVTARLSITPSTRPPSMAPRMLPMPPSTAAV